MCGFAGFLDASSNQDAAESILERMNRRLVHRGPDDEGRWFDPEVGLAIGHRRLSILDLSKHGHQPMVSACGRYVLAYNGEIYNFRELREELRNAVPDYTWHSESDTEVALVAVQHWGVASAVERFLGMFAFALWDRQEKILHLVRDRLGIKPLYYGWQGGVFFFGSELKPFTEHPRFTGEVDRNVLASFLRFGYVPDPFSIYEGIFKLVAGGIASLSAPIPQSLPKPRRYWDCAEVALECVRTPFEGADTEAIETLESLLRDSVQRRMISDVPLGAFLSGGIDSSLVVGLMQAQSSTPVKTFSIGFEEEKYNEAVYAKQVAEHLRTDHTELYVRPQDALDVIPKLPELYDEPFADSSQIPTFLVSQMARRHVTVSLSGDGGDELFGGYDRYFLANYLWNRLRWVPGSVRRMMSRGITCVSAGQWTRLFNALKPALPKSLQVDNPGDAIHRLCRWIEADGFATVFRNLVSQWDAPQLAVPHSREPETFFDTGLALEGFDNASQHMMWLDACTYMRDDNLTKVDRASMGVSLEVRVPLIDHRVVEFAWRLPLDMKIRAGKTKWLLRQILYRYVPEELIERPKKGFSIPLAHWLRGPLRDWVENLIDESRLRREGFFNVALVRKKWNEHLSGQRNWDTQLWTVLMFQSWLERQNGFSQ